MGRPIHKLTDVAVKGRKAPGMHADGGNLYLRVAPGGSKGWIFRYTMHGKTRDAGLGSYPTVSLAQAREEADRCRKLVAAGTDPIAASKTEHQVELVKAAKAARTFEQAAKEYFDARAAGYRCSKTPQLLLSALRRYAFPRIGALPVAAIDTGLVLEVLRPLWPVKPAAANSLRQSLEGILSAAKVLGYRSGENPARWRDNLDQLLPKRSKVRPVRHHAALPYDEIPAFVLALRACDDNQPVNAQPQGSPVKQGVSLRALALELLILTATRTNEVMGARWDEVDLGAAVWTIPAERMKGRKEHRVPLAPRAVAIFREMASVRINEHIFPGMKEGQSASDMGLRTLLDRLRPNGAELATKHGFRSSFRDWSAEETSTPNHVVEMALAHAIKDQTERAYRRGDLFQKRRQLMIAWAAYCERKPADVLPMRRRQAS